MTSGWFETGKSLSFVSLSHDNLWSNAIRHRISLSAALICTIGIGLASRQLPALFPAVLEKYPGDALWAQMVYWLVCICTPTASVLKVALYSLAISYVDEISQLYQSNWINQIRSTTPGHLLLGSHFSWMDMVSYTIGIAIVLPFDWWSLKAKRAGSPDMQAGVSTANLRR